MVKKDKAIKYYEAVGKRKRSVARVRLYIVNKDKTALIKEKKYSAGDIIVNSLPVDKYFPADYHRSFLITPLKLTENRERFVVSIIVKGGGINGQLEAVVHGLSRAIDLVDKEAYHPILKKEKLLTRDQRKKERRKVGTGGKARRKKQSPKR